MRERAAPHASLVFLQKTGGDSPASLIAFRGYSGESGSFGNGALRSSSVIPLASIGGLVSVRRIDKGTVSLFN